MTTNTGSIPVIGPDPENAGHPRSLHFPDSDLPSDLSPPSHVRETTPPDMPEGDSESPSAHLVDEWDWPDLTPIYLIDYALPPMEVRGGKPAGSYLDRVRFKLALLVVLVGLGVPTTMAFLHYPSSDIIGATAALGTPVMLTLGYYFGRKIIRSRKKRK